MDLKNYIYACIMNIVWYFGSKERIDKSLCIIYRISPYVIWDNFDVLAADEGKVAKEDSLRWN